MPGASQRRSDDLPVARRDGDKEAAGKIRRAKRARLESFVDYAG
jgi:hypothetical protein